MHGEKNIVAYSLLILSINVNQETTEEFNYKRGNLSEINYIKKFPEGIFPINLKWIDQYQRKYTNLMAKYKNHTYKKVSFTGGSNIYLERIKFKDKIIILLILKKIILYWYHTYLLHPRMDRTDEMILQQLYWPGITNTLQKEVTNINNFQCKNQ